MARNQLFVCEIDGCVSNLQKCPVCEGKMKPYSNKNAHKAKRFPRISSPQAVEQRRVAGIIEEVCANFACPGKVLSFHAGPIVTEYKFKPNKITRVKNIKNLNEDLAVAIPAESVTVMRVPGEKAMGITVPNKVRGIVNFQDSLQAVIAHRNDMALPINLGVTAIGEPVVIDLAEQPHMLIAGSTGTGKSVLLNGILTSLLYVRSPRQLELFLIDPKQVELTPYTGLPHVTRRPVSSTYDALELLRLLTEEMKNRMSFMSYMNAKNLPQLNAKRLERGEEILPHWVLVIDEFAQLVLDEKKAFNDAIGTLTNQARAAGIHIIAATQRPSVDVIKGAIKSNFLCRVGLRLPSASDSKTIFGRAGAEQLLGKGDLWLMSPGFPGLKRVHSPHCTEEDIHKMLQLSSSIGHINHCPADGPLPVPPPPPAPEAPLQEEEAVPILSRSQNLFLKERNLTYEQAQKQTPEEQKQLNEAYRAWQKHQRERRGVI